MESLLEPVELNRETAQALDEIRSGAENALYGASSADAEAKVNRLVLPLIEGSGLPNLHVIHYRWFLREVARHWRTRKGRDLAFHLELCVRKWVHLGLEPRTLQFLICEAHQRLKSGALDCGSAAPAFPDRTDGPEKAAAVLPHSTELRSPTQTPSAESAQSVDVRSLATAKDAKAEPGPTTTGQSVESAKSVDVHSGTTPSATSASSAVVRSPGSDSSTGTEQSAESA